MTGRCSCKGSEGTHAPYHPAFGVELECKESRLADLDFFLDETFLVEVVFALRHTQTKATEVGLLGVDQYVAQE
jgi:hypothetical protein